MLTQVRRLAPAVGLATHLGHGVQRIATDRTIGHIRALPRRTADLDAACLSRLLGRTVTSVTARGGGACRPGYCGITQEIAVMALPFGKPSSTEAWK